MNSLEHPPATRLLRRVDPISASSLKQRLKEDCTGIGIPPFAVASTNVTEKQNSKPG